MDGHGGAKPKVVRCGAKGRPGKATAMITVPEEEKERKGKVKERLLRSELSDEHAQVAGLLLLLSHGEPLRYAVATWVALEIFGVDEATWRAFLDALTAAGLAAVEWESPSRAAVVWE